MAKVQAKGKKRKQREQTEYRLWFVFCAESEDEARRSAESAALEFPNMKHTALFEVLPDGPSYREIR